MLTQKHFLNQIEEILESDTDVLSGDEIISELEGWDSLAILGLIVKMDQHYNISVTTEELNECKKLNNLFSLVKAKLPQI